MSIKVRLGKETCSFTIDELEAMQYFEILFSDRWHGTPEKGSIVTPFDEKEPLFTISDMKLLLRVISHKKIPSDLRLSVQQMQQLINCDTFLMGRENIVDEVMLIEYLKNAKNGWNADQRDKMEEECTNQILKHAFKTYNNELNKLKNELRSKIVGRAHKINLNLIGFDGGTNDAMFEKMFQLSYDHYADYDVKISMVNESKDQIKKLKKLWDDRVYSTNNINNGNDSSDDSNNNNRPNILRPVVTLINTLVDYFAPLAKRTIKVKDPNLHDFLCSMINDIMDDMLSGRIQSNYGDGLMLANIIKAEFRLVYEYGQSYDNAYGKYKPLLEACCQRECEMIMQFILHQNQHYRQNYNNIASDSEEETKTKLNLWAKLIDFGIRQCGARFIVRYMDLWFPITRGEDANDEYLINKKMDNIINHMGTNNKFQIALILCEYLTYSWTGQGKPPSQYEQFIKDQIGWDWKLYALND